MNANFELSEKLRLYLQIASNYRALTLGVRYPVSIRKRTKWYQSIVIYPESDFYSFLGSEVMCFVSLAKGLDLDSSIDVEGGLPVIEITDYSIGL